MFIIIIIIVMNNYRNDDHNNFYDYKTKSLTAEVKNVGSNPTKEAFTNGVNGNIVVPTIRQMGGLIPPW